MTSYFDEHNCEPLGENQQPNHQLHLARLLIDTGAAAEMAEEFERLFDRKVPATSKEVISSLPTRCIEADDPNLSYIDEVQGRLLKLWFGVSKYASTTALMAAVEWRPAPESLAESIIYGIPIAPLRVEDCPSLTLLGTSQTRRNLGLWHSNETGSKCPVCLGVYGPGQEVKELPCSHSFHTSCILPWLNKVNTCPLCRLELPTDDEEYEAIRKHKARQKQREFELEMLHNSMFG